MYSTAFVGSALASKSFKIDDVNKQFLLNGEAFAIISGEFHYFRCMPQRWRKIMKSMRAAGLNTVST